MRFKRPRYCQGRSLFPYFVVFRIKCIVVTFLFVVSCVFPCLFFSAPAAPKAPQALFFFFQKESFCVQKRPLVERGLFHIFFAIFLPPSSGPGRPRPGRPAVPSQRTNKEDSDTLDRLERIDGYVCIYVYISTACSSRPSVDCLAGNDCLAGDDCGT